MSKSNLIKFAPRWAMSCMSSTKQYPWPFLRPAGDKQSQYLTKSHLISKISVMWLWPDASKCTKAYFSSDLRPGGAVVGTRSEDNWWWNFKKFILLNKLLQWSVRFNFEVQINFWKNKTFRKHILYIVRSKICALAWDILNKV